MKQFTPQQTRRVNALVRAECCNYFQGNCDALDAGEPVHCPQITSQSMLCLWFQKAVLPIDKILCAELSDAGNMKRCEKCRAPFLPGGNRAKYCHTCADRIRRQKEAERSRKNRARKQGLAVRI